MITKHILKLEDLDMDLTQGDQIKSILNGFLVDLGYSQDRISGLDCRRRDGFIPYSHNKGGFEAVAFRHQLDCWFDITGFKNTDKALDKHHSYNREMFLEDILNIKKTDDIPEDKIEEFDDYCRDGGDTVIFSCDLMLTSETELNIRICIGAKDTPYHRQYDDKIEFDIEFKSPQNLENQLKDILKNKEVELFTENLNEAY